MIHRATYRVIYGDTDQMGMAYHANFLRWFEIGRAEMFRFLGLTYKQIEQRGVYLPVAEVQCRFMAPVFYDDILFIDTRLDRAVKGGMKFDYALSVDGREGFCARGFTKHACVDRAGRVIRPPNFIWEAVDGKQ
jgi:acyl-CoA thioester hydrolase